MKAPTDNFTFVRLLAAFLVLYSHQHALTGRPEPTFIGVHSLGGLGVLVFFSISGFLITRSWLSDPHVVRFAIRRLLRIWPAFAAVILIAALVLAPTLTSLPLKEFVRHPWTREYISSNLAFRLREGLPGLKFEGSALPFAVNGSLWTIPLELKCYGLLAAAGVAGAFRKRFVVPAVTAALVLLYAVVQVRGDWLVADGRMSIEGLFFVEFLIFFLIGASLQLVWPSDRTKLVAPLVLAGIGGAAALALGRPMLAAMLWVPLTSLWAATGNTVLLNRFGQFGDPSYGFYLFAFPVQQLMVYLLRNSLDWWSLLALAIVVTTACALLSWHLIEKWALRFRPPRR